MTDASHTWRPDFLGPDYSALRLQVPRADGTARRATLVRHRPGGGLPSPAARRGAPAHTGAGGTSKQNSTTVLYIHGWSDYFYNTGLAEFFTGLGYSFYALDLHNHGRSLTSPELGGYVDNLSDYDDEITLAHAVISADAAQPSGAGPDAGAGPSGPGVPLVLMGHSTGGLIAALWASHNQGSVAALVLNSPWLEIQGGAAIRRAATPLVHPFAELRPLTRMRVPERTFYWRGISNEAQGEWPVDRRLRPPQAFPVRAGWMRAIMAAQREVAAGLDLHVPVLVLLSAKSMLGPVWSDAMLAADVALDVRSLALRAVSLGDSIAIERISGALHEVFLSRQAVREDAYRRLKRWLSAYNAGCDPD
ncbi:alpha-beta hydrolase superfamily lysophospholipase [Arthrobacter silviterrae]|uniref:Alpha/beta hydrolase n=1 Tax=Arthrobacter silviterrae TaxID=2026658 RepID=A0ABX0DEV1_9MICC|nr:alpha/beta hydrolase [Arthrobacter silviterrae]MDQ0276256.1 alpha-beta hydrolase superfamily lysophospholipase [Arthrobacter silviterrae]NGN85163.1 alpha/beta hydrolase [Arthrobacter silviterrae]